MATNKEHVVNTAEKVKNDGAQRLPSERDEAPAVEHAQPRHVMRQAASDIEQGLVDTDLHGQRGVEKTRNTTPQPAHARPQPGSKDN